MAEMGVAGDKAVVRSVLIVDNDAAYAQQLKKMIEQSGFRATVTTDGGQAQSTFTMKRPDFVILDLILPGESGFEVCERMKQVDDKVPVLIHSAIDIDESRDLAADVGADGYVTKPVDPDTLESMIRDIAQIVWNRVHGLEEDNSERRIEFACRCGKRYSMSYKNRGKSMTCSQCHEPLRVPKMVQNLRKDSDAFSEKHAGEDADSSEPLNYVTIKCQHCATYYHMSPKDLEKARVCPKCEQQQVGPLLIAGIPLTRAALASSRRVLVILSGKRKGKKLLLPDQAVLVGSDETCQIRVPTADVDRQHAMLRPTPQGILVRDLGSEHGTYVNDLKITAETLLQPEDVLRIGALVLQLAGHKAESLLNGKKKDGEDEEQPEEPVDEYDEHVVKAVKKKDDPRSTAQLAAIVIQKHWEIVNLKAPSA